MGITGRSGEEFPLAVIQRRMAVMDAPETARMYEIPVQQEKRHHELVLGRAPSAHLLLSRFSRNETALSLPGLGLLAPFFVASERWSRSGALALPFGAHTFVMLKETWCNVEIRIAARRGWAITGCCWHA
jgi:hypothetical protein